MICRFSKIRVWNHLGTLRYSSVHSITTDFFVWTRWAILDTRYCTSVEQTSLNQTLAWEAVVQLVLLLGSYLSINCRYQTWKPLPMTLHKQIIWRCYGLPIWISMGQIIAKQTHRQVWELTKLLHHQIHHFEVAVWQDNWSISGLSLGGIEMSRCDRTANYRRCHQCHCLHVARSEREKKERNGKAIHEHINCSNKALPGRYVDDIDCACATP